MNTKIRFKVVAFDNKNRLLKDYSFHAENESEVNNHVDDVTDFLLQVVEDVQAGEYE